MRPALLRRPFACSLPAAGLALLCHATPSRAAPPLPPASFNCATAQGVDERLICSDPLLRAADKTLATAYRAARAANPARKAALRSDEHSWILRRNADCGITKYTIVNAGNRPGFVDCLLDGYAERLADLTLMKLHPQADPASISEPIRRSFLAGPGPSAMQADITLSTFQLPDGGPAAALAWQPDGTLLILQADAGSGEDIYAAHANTPPVLLFKNTHHHGFTDPAGHPIPLQPGSAPAAPAGDVITISNGAGTTLQLGPVKTGRTPQPRFVTITTNGGTQPVTPPIRIDSRFHLTARYAAFAGVFIVFPANDPARLDYAAERRWSKSNCLAYWLVSPAGTAQPACIPFGPYLATVPAPVLTKNAVYLLAPGYGLYRIENGAPLAVIAGDFTAATVSPDGCAIALAMHGGGAPPSGPGLQIGGGNAVTVLSVCKRGLTSTPGTTPAAP